MAQIPHATPQASTAPIIRCWISLSLNQIPKERNNICMRGPDNIHATSANVHMPKPRILQATWPTFSMRGGGSVGALYCPAFVCEIGPSTPYILSLEQLTARGIIRSPVPWVRLRYTAVNGLGIYAPCSARISATAFWTPRCRVSKLTREVAGLPDFSTRGEQAIVLQMQAQALAFFKFTQEQ